MVATFDWMATQTDLPVALARGFVPEKAGEGREVLACEALERIPF